MSKILNRLDFNLLQLLLYIYDTGSVSSAGRSLALSQPASSNALARLRDALGDPLFIRGKDGMLPTAYTERVVPEIRQYLDGIEKTLTAPSVFNPNECERTFYLSLSGLGEAVFLPRLAAKLIQQAPKVRLENTEIPNDRLAAALADGQVDIAIGNIDTTVAGLECCSLFNDHFVAVVGQSFRARIKTLKDLQKQAIAVIAPSATFAHSIDRLLQQFELDNQVCIRLRHFGAIDELIMGQELVSIVPYQFASTLKKRSLVKILDIKLPTEPMLINLVWHRKTTREPALVWLRSQVIDLFMEKPGRKTDTREDNTFLS